MNPNLYIMDTTAMLLSSMEINIYTYAVANSMAVHLHYVSLNEAYVKDTSSASGERGDTPERCGHLVGEDMRPKFDLSVNSSCKKRPYTQRGRAPTHDGEKIMRAFFMYEWTAYNPSIREFCKQWPIKLNERTFRKLRAKYENSGEES